MVEMRVTGLTLDPQTKMPTIILHEEGGNAVLSLLVGPMEAMSVSFILNNEDLPRPLAHDLLLMVVRGLKAEVVGVEIADLKDGIYYALLLVRNSNGLLRLDCRPSDAIAVALKAEVPIRVHPRVLQKAQELKKHETAQRAAGEVVRPRADAATEMAREVDARREADKLSGRLAHGDELVSPASCEKRYESLLRSLEPVTNRKM